MEIYNNTAYKNISNTNISKTESMTINKQDTIDKTLTDSIEISEKNSNAINTKKAYDAFKDANS